MSQLLRVGIIGVSLKRGWATVSHVPAVQQVPGMELAGVTARDQSTADAIAEAVGAKRGFGDVGAMVQDPSIDLITVAVRVPSHRELVLAALTAGKHVYCEWPLGRDVKESEELRDAATSAGVHTAIGLQSRANPALKQARALVEEGSIGRVLSARLYSGTVAFGPKTTPADVYLEDGANGATLVSIHGGHALDAVIAVLGELADLSAIGSIQYPEVEIEGQREKYHRTIPDRLLTIGRLRGGCAVSVDVDGGRSSHTTFSLEVVGERAVLTLDGGAPRGFQSGRLTLAVDGEPKTVNEGDLARLPDAAFNVGAMYAGMQCTLLN